MIKVFRSSERNWKDGLDLQTLQDIAYASVGREKSDKDIDDCVRAMFGKSVEAGVKCPLRRRRVAEEWEEKLCAMDGRTRQKRKAPEPLIFDALSSTCLIFDDSGHGVMKQAASGPAISTPTAPVITPLKRRRVMEGDIQKAGGKEWDIGKTKKSKVPLGVVTNTMPVCTPSGTQRFNAPSTPPQNQENSRGPGMQASNAPLLTVARQLPTPFTSPVRPPPSKEEAVNIAEAAKADHDIVQVLRDAHVAFVRLGSSKTKCRECSKLKKVVPTERRIHSVESLLAACGWSQAGVMGAYVVRGVVVVEDQGISSDQGEKIRQRLETRSREDKDRRRKPITIVMCDGRIHEFR